MKYLVLNFKYTMASEQKGNHLYFRKQLARQMTLKVLFLLILCSLTSQFATAQRGVRIGYIDTEYILQNVPEYQDATVQLDGKVQQWKVDIEQRLSAIDTKKKQLNGERVLLTKELYEERLEDISFEEAEILDYQQKRFGPNGDLMIQKEQLIQPIQDQIFSAVQEIAGNKQYDFIFDKSADVVMLYSADRFDISELVLRSITRSSKRTQAKNKVERREAEQEDVVPVINEELEEREKALEEKKSAREKEVDARRAAQMQTRDSLKAAAEARRQKILDDRAKAKADRDSINNSSLTPKPSDTTSVQKIEVKPQTTTSAGLPKEPTAVEKKAQLLSDRERRRQELEERKAQILADRKKAKEEREAQKVKTDSLPQNN